MNTCKDLLFSYLYRDWIRDEMRVLAPAAFASRRPHHKNSPEPRQSTGASRAPPEPPYQPASHAPTPESGPSFSPTRRVRRTVRQSPQHTAAVTPAPGTSHIPPPSPRTMHVDLHENDSGANSPLVDPPLDTYVDVLSSSNPNVNESYTPLVDTRSALRSIHHPSPGFSTALTIPGSDSNATAPGAILDVMIQTTPQLVSLTQSLNNVDLSGIASNPYESVMKCMEAAAMLERQLARIATGLRSTAP
jgi:hypothetical protein